MKINVGDKVAYSVDFLCSIGCQTGDLPFARGIVKEIKSLSEKLVIATIDWNNPEIPEKVATFNLAKVGPNARFCKC